MSQDLVSIAEIAKQHDRNRQTIHKIVKRMGLPTVLKKTKTEEARGQKLSHISIDDYKLLEKTLLVQGNQVSNEEQSDLSPGMFYFILLEPELDPGRFKVGFASDVHERMRSHKTTAPFLKLVKQWPCRHLWEKTAIDCVTEDCKRLYTEVYRTEDIQRTVDRADKFFRLMPVP